MPIHQYEALQHSAARGDTEAIAEILRIAVGTCECANACFFQRRAREFLAGVGIRISA